MTTLFARLARRPGLSTSDRHRLLLYAVGLHRDGIRGNEIEASLQNQGASACDARSIDAEAVLRLEAEAAAVELPDVARLPINLYFALGVTPSASSDRIRSAYRRLAREVHPDLHSGELNVRGWNRVMTVVAEAEKLLLDHDQRRAYDVFWLRRSRKVTAANKSDLERRGDWETRYHWYMAEIAEIEDRLAAMLDRLAATDGEGAVEAALAAVPILEEYEERVLHVRNQTYAVPEEHMALPRRVRGELQRKDRLIRDARRVVEEALRIGTCPNGSLSALLDRLADTGEAHRRFDVQELAAKLAA